MFKTLKADVATPSKRSFLSQNDVVRRKSEYEAEDGGRVALQGSLQFGCDDALSALIPALTGVCAEQGHEKREGPHCSLATVDELC